MSTTAIGRIVAGTTLGGFAAAVALVAGPFAGAQEHVIAGSTLAVFALAWAILALATSRWTDQPQRWATVPAITMGSAAATLLLLAPTGNPLGWLWPPVTLALVGWMVARSRRDLRSRARVLVLYPVFGVLGLAAIGGGYETYREARDGSTPVMPGRLVDVGGHRLHLQCTGSGRPTVVLEPGLGEPSPMMAAWIAPDVARATRVCVYDRAGRGWSESARHPQDGAEVATDLRTLLARAGEPGPYVLAGHSAGGIYVLNFATLFPQDVAGVVLLDSMHPEQYTRMDSWPRFYEMFRRASAAMAPLARLGIGRVAYGGQFDDLPPVQRDQERAFLATPRHHRSVRDEFSRIRAAMAQAAMLTGLGSRPLIVVTATVGADADWAGMQEHLGRLSTDSVQRLLPDATHETTVSDRRAARQSSQAIHDVVTSVRTGTPINAQEG
jgi:pimeloyl-ACP methyl ester carboxylesterase